MRASAGELPLYNGANELERKQGMVEKHHIALSKNKKIDGRWVFDKEQKVDGELTQTLWQIVTDDTLQNIANFYQAWVSGADKEVLFQCDSRSCGSSNQWANGFFQHKQLYGPDANQYYWVVKQQNTYTIIYLIERGNRNIYLYVEELQPRAMVTHFRLQIPEGCIFDQAFISANPELLQEAEFEYLLIVSLTKPNTLESSQTKAEECVKAFSKAFPALKVHALGLGEFSASLNRKVKMNQIELIRLE